MAIAVTHDFTPKANAGLTSTGGNNVIGTLETTGAIAMYKITLDADSDGTNDNPIALNGADKDGANGSLYDLILREVAPLMAWAPNGATGVIHVVVDSHANSAASLAARIEALPGVGTDTVVAAAASFVIS
jgi:hypothetical protein